MSVQPVCRVSVSVTEADCSVGWVKRSVQSAVPLTPAVVVWVAVPCRAPSPAVFAAVKAHPPAVVVVLPLASIVVLLTSIGSWQVAA